MPAGSSTPTARRTGRKLVVGYILRHHPSWMRLIDPRRARWAAPMSFA